MAKDLDVIKKYSLKLSYICPVTGKEMILTSRPGNTEFEVNANGGDWPNDTNISIPDKCKSCGRYHDSFKIQQY